MENLQSLESLALARLGDVPQLALDLQFVESDGLGGEVDALGGHVGVSMRFLSELLDER